MTGDERAHVDDETRSLLAELWETPVGRRWVLKAGLGSAVALGVGLHGVRAAEAIPKKKKHRVETTDLHFALGHVHGVSRMTLFANGRRMPLVRHTKASRETLRRRGGLWGIADLSQLTHHVSGVRMPADQALLVSVRGRRGRREVLVAQLWRVPRASTIRLARASHRASGSFKHVLGSPRRLARLGVKPAQIRSARHVAQLGTIVDVDTTATGFVSVHPNIATKNGTAATVTGTVLGQLPAITALSKAIARVQLAKKDVASYPIVTNPDGKSTQITINKVTSTFMTFEFNPSKDRGLKDTLAAGLTAGVGAVRDNASLGAVITKPLDQDATASTQTWVQPQGVIFQPQPVTVSRKGAGIDIKVANPGFLFGTQTDVSSGYNNGQVGLTLYNNFVRWVWVYVQYIGKGNENLSLNPNPTWPDTKYAQSLGLLPQVFTVLGVPLWDTNTINVTLDFPQEAHTARLLFCGLGSNLLDGRWRDYFPTDAYTDAIAPQDEVLVASLITGIATIGLSVFALATDIDIARTWAEAKSYITQWIRAANLQLVQALTRSVVLTATELLAVTVAAGVATHEDVVANGGDGNIWSILLPLGTAIIKLLFAPGSSALWVGLAGIIGGEEAQDKLIDALPVVGQVIAVIEAVGDAITLAEVCAETIVSPWVIENEVNLTYPATITINRSVNPPDSTFPATARSYRLEAKIDGAVVLQPYTATVNPNGNLQTGPLTVPVTAPFGGEKIQWSVVFLTDTGRQVGTGVSAEFTNNDPSNPPSDVSITITELPFPIDANTVFKRAVTTGYSASAGGYTWTDQITDEGTVQSTGIQQVMGTTISTLAAAAGMVWEQGNKFYIRGLPIAQNGSTISLGPATHEGYTRRPFLLYDPFVDRKSAGNHVLLEPDPTTNAYHVHKVSLDPTTGAPTWDPNTSHGTFPLSVSAAALHSSGRIVVVDTDSGRLGSLLPGAPATATANPVLASYTAGTGTQVGLLSSPIAVAVTNPGIVIVLEAANSQLAAFDLNGNPVPYFGRSVTRRSLVAQVRKRGASPGQYTMALTSTGTYLDLGADGAGQMYLLYYTGDGSAPNDYHVDVYTAAGTLIESNSAGVNVPRIAVDYWRSIFAANYNELADVATGKAHIDPALGVVEPSVSRFDPTEVTRRRAKSKPKPKPKKKPRPRKPKRT